MAGKGQPKTGGRQKGSLNKTTATIKVALEAAFQGAGGVDYLIKQAEANPVAFMTLLGKIIPAQVQAELTGKDGGPLTVEKIERIIIKK